MKGLPMKMLQCLTHAAVVLACCGILMPQAAVAAGPPAKPSNDVALTSDGTFTGRVLNSEGQPLDGAVVSIRQSGQEVARVVSTAEGTFSVAGLSSGVYEVAVGPQVAPVRVWPAEAAPPNAHSQALMVVGNAARGQSLVGLDIITLWTLGASTGALILAALNQSDLNSLDKKVDRVIELVSP
jgi:hypothetical protein